LEDYREIKHRFGYMPFMWIRVALAEGEFAFGQQEFVRAATLMEELYSDLCETGIRYLRPDVLHLQGRALLEQGPTRAEEARATLAQARAEAEALGSRRTLWPILMAMSEIERQRGHPREAEALHRQARGIVDHIAHHLGTPELRASFLNLPQASAVLST
jgi:hypothetical protein